MYACMTLTDRVTPPLPHPLVMRAGAGSQGELMHSDECIIVDVNDNIVGHASKHDAHRSALLCRGTSHSGAKVELVVVLVWWDGA